jgi:hypothetical protein
LSASAPRRYGENSNAYRIRVLGQFPTTDDNTLVSAELVDSAMARDVPLDLQAPELWIGSTSRAAVSFDRSRC